MRYSYEFKKHCVELYQQGIMPECPEKIQERSFRKMVQIWVRYSNEHGLEALEHINRGNKITMEERIKIVSRVVSGESALSIAIEYGISHTSIYKWVRQYKMFGYNGLVNNVKEHKPRKPKMKKKKSTNAKPAKIENISEHEELLRLREEVAYLQAENAVIKKRIALRKEKEAAHLKAKKQQSSKNSAKKDPP